MHKEFPMEKLCYFCLFGNFWSGKISNMKWLDLDIKMYLVDILT